MIQLEETQKSVIKNTELFVIPEEDRIEKEVIDGWFLEEDSYKENVSLMDYPFSIDNNYECRSQE